MNAEEELRAGIYEDGYEAGYRKAREEMLKILEKVKDTEGEQLAKYPIEIAIKMQTDYLTGYADCWFFIYKELGLSEDNHSRQTKPESVAKDASSALDEKQGSFIRDKTADTNNQEVKA